MSPQYPELPLDTSPEGLEDRAEWQVLRRRLDRMLKPLSMEMDAASCARRFMGFLRIMNVEVVLLKASTSHETARTDNGSGVRRAVLSFDQPEAAGKKIASGTLPFVGYENLWQDLATLAARTFLGGEQLIAEDEDLLAAVRDYLFVPGSVVRDQKRRGETPAIARHRIWCFHSLPLSMYGAHKRPGRKSTKARHRLDIPSSYRKSESVLQENP